MTGAGQVLTRREANVFACLVQTVVTPGGALPALAHTDAVASFDDLLGRLPTLNRVGLRMLLYVLELGPLVLGAGARMRRLDATRRTRYVRRAERSPLGAALVAIAKLSYYGDAGVMRALGYDADAVVARGRALRAAEARW